MPWSGVIMTLFTPRVLQVISEIREVADQEGVELCLCGEMASDPLNFLSLFCLGIRGVFHPRTVYSPHQGFFKWR